jgi:hypothetical protein
MEQHNPGTAAPAMATNVKPRPTFLTVLCILSFVGVGLVVLSSFFNMFIYSGAAARNTIENANQILQEQNSPLGTFVENTDEFVSTTFTMNLTAFISSFVCLAGVILMWKLKKAGFYIYSISEIAYPVIGLTLIGRAGLGSSFFASIMVLAVIISLIFAIGFIIMYGVNLKHMN